MLTGPLVKAAVLFPAGVVVAGVVAAGVVAAVVDSIVGSEVCFAAAAEDVAARQNRAAAGRTSPKLSQTEL